MQPERRKVEPLIEKQDPWTQFEGQESPNIFSHLKLADDSGFGDVRSLYDPSRWVSAALLILFVIYNVTFVVSLDIGFITDPDNVEGYTTEEIAKINGDFYMTRKIYDGGFTLINSISGKEVFAVSKIKPTQVLGFLEFVGISCHLVQGIFIIGCIGACKGYKRWYAVSAFFMDTLPILSLYSAMKLLDKIVPAKLTANLSAELALKDDRQQNGSSCLRAWSSVIELLVKTVVCFIVGFDMFLLKLRVVNTNAGRDQVSMADLSPCILFLVQVLGVVQMGPFVRQRLFVFIFAGEDAILQEREKNKMLTWNALLSRSCFTECSFSQFLAVMMSFSDEDFQKLVFNEDAIKDVEEPARPKINPVNKSSNSVNCFDSVQCCTTRAGDRAVA